MRKPIIAGNWKMYKTGAQAAAMIQDLKPLIEGAAAEVVICPPFTALEAAVAAARYSAVAIGAQNVHWEAEGAFTGEISPTMLKDAGVRLAIVGHSERRQYFGETDAGINKRAKAALKHGLVPIICVGERLEERESGKTNAVVGGQLRACLADFTPEMVRGSVIAYEPVWAIGTGKVATPDQAQEVHAYLRSILKELIGAAAEDIRIQYGGSVKADNAATLLAQPDIDGALVGGASLEAAPFAAIVRAAK